MRAVRRAVGAILCVFLVAASSAEARHRRTSRKSPHEEIVGLARVESEPRRTTHANGREFEEFDASVVTARPAPDQDSDADARLALDAGQRIHVVHDLSCGGRWVDARPGDRLDVKGELVRPPRGSDILHFTHPADQTCGRGGSHADGYLRRHTEVTR